MLVTACGRIGFAPLGGDVAVDGPIASLCKGASLDGNGNGIPDACDACVLAGIACDQGVPVGGLPTYSERVTAIGWNLARAEPIGFRDQYMRFGDGTASLVFATNPAPAPLLQLRLASIEVAHAHTKDRVTCKASAQPSTSYCDGTVFATWSAPAAPIDFYQDYVLGPFAWTAALPIQVFGATVCGGPVDAMARATGCGDDSTRTQITDPARQQIGTGAGYDGIDFTLWDYLLTNTDSPFAYPIAAAGHLVFEGAIHFIAELEVAEAPHGVYLAIDGALMPMATGLGTATRGAYRIVQPLGNACRSYHFIVQSADDRIWRYPASGELRTTGESCVEEWIP